ncbi:MAG: DUF3078 domain-containing protein [Tannerellaceae bacterium]|jgi:hypothetical protein|nr:DUF3078 domain-containing protein [Tannerellaceae bacterium]
MNVKRNCLYSIVLIWAFACSYAEAQQANTLMDTVVVIAPDDMDKIPDLRTQLNMENETYSEPAPANSRLLRFVQDNKTGLSDEALYWARLVMDASSRFGETMNFGDTIIVDHIFMPPLFRGNVLPGRLYLYDKDILKSGTVIAPWFQPDTTLFLDVLEKYALDDKALRYIEDNYPAYFHYSKRDLPDDIIKIANIRTPAYDEVPLKVTSSVVQSDMEAPEKFIPDRLYWRSSFESAIQFSQNYVSPNWHKGGSSNLNIFTKNYLKYDYNKDKVQITNEIEIKASVYNAPNDTLHDYKIGDDILRLHSNIGYKAFNKWFYTFDTEFKTQLFSNYQENTQVKQAALLSPFTFNAGIGMKYDLKKTFKERNRNLNLSINFAPVSYTFMKSLNEDIDLGRHGFRKNEETDKYSSTLNRFGMTIRTDMMMNFNRNVSWQSRLYYFTTYEITQFEFENTLVLAITRHFSTRIYAHLRFDDSVIKKADFNSYFQLNELLSFGFNYKW